MNTLYVMIGLPGSGKSTWQPSSSSYIRISTDDIRFELSGDSSDQSQNDSVFKIAFQRVRENLLDRDVIFDATNTTRKSRSKILEAVKDIECYKIAVPILTPVDICCKRDAARDRQVGEAVIDKFYRGYEYPQEFEGFDEIQPYYDTKSLRRRQRPLTALLFKIFNFNQNNPHHKYDLFTHSMLVADKYRGSDDVRFLAGVYHDIGKLYTKTEDGQGISHYYNHANIGTYELALRRQFSGYECLKDDKNWNEFLFYVNYHMLAHEIKGEKSIKRYSKIFGEDGFNKLMEFAKADSLATGVEQEFDINKN